jgi:hypothetical protein
MEKSNKLKPMPTINIQKSVDVVLERWLILQKIIKEEITLNEISKILLKY